MLRTRKKNAKWYEALIRFVKTDKVFVHYINWAAKWDEWVSTAEVGTRLAPRNTHTKEPHQTGRYRSSGGGSYSYTSYWSSGYSYYSNEKGKPTYKGFVGLRNLGNTCFMNSTLQCLAQSPGLTDYFVTGSYKKEINDDNPLGWKGKVATAWANLVRDIFSNQYTTIAPREFKKTIGEFAPRFMGYQQQDSSELLSFLLDGIHEDLNRVKKKPPTSPVESNGRVDKVVAQEAWETHLKRNQSVIVDYMQGQLKSRVECPDCGKISITFDPFMFLSVPLPAEKHKTVEVTYMPYDGVVAPKTYQLNVLKIGDIRHLADVMAKTVGVDPKHLIFADIWKGKVHRVLKPNDLVGDIRHRTDDIFCYHAPPPQEAGEEKPNPQPLEAAAAEVPEANEAGEAGAPPEPAGEVGAAPPGAAAENDMMDVEDNQEGGGAANREGEGGGGRGGGDRRRGDGKGYHEYVVRHNIKKRNPYYQAGASQWVKEFEDSPKAVPFVLVLPTNKKVTNRMVRSRIVDIIRPHLASPQDINMEDLPFKITYSEYLRHGDRAEVADNEEEFDLSVSPTFVLDWTRYNEFNEDRLFKEVSKSDDPNAHRKQKVEKLMTLNDCLKAFAERETLSESDAWYCSRCKKHQCATKEMGLWKLPDLLIVHLKRFAYTRVWRDRINTLVNFPLEGLDLGEWVQNEDDKPNAIYDCYGISNHMGGMAGGHYTAYARGKDDGKWMHCDDSHVSRVGNPQNMIGRAAYVLYYVRRGKAKWNQKSNSAKDTPSSTSTSPPPKSPSSQEDTPMPNLEPVSESSAEKSEKPKSH